ncbi:MAG: hypothetical protein PHU31_06080 [Anaerotignum sp.]|nr:hypothetical protein [Anaerotignum sp.]
MAGQWKKKEGAEVLVFFLTMGCIIVAPLILFFVVYFAEKAFFAIQDVVSYVTQLMKRRHREGRLLSLKTLTKEELIGAAMAGDAYALEIITEPKTLERIRKETSSETVRREICNKLGHEWILTKTELHQCSMSDTRGSGQYLDPCYGVDCQFCDANNWTEYTYTCQICGMTTVTFTPQGQE